MRSSECLVLFQELRIIETVMVVNKTPFYDNLPDLAINVYRVFTLMSNLPEKPRSPNRRSTDRRDRFFVRDPGLQNLSAAAMVAKTMAPKTQILQY